MASSQTEISLEKRILDLFAHLGIERAHLGGRGPNDWSGLVHHHPDAVSSLTLVCPNGLDPDSVRNVESRLLILSGDRGAGFDSLSLDDFPGDRVSLLEDYETWGWTDMVSDRTDEIGDQVMTFLTGDSLLDTPPMDPPDVFEGEVAGITYRVRGSGSPLILMPLFLAPSQWEPLIPALSERFTTITLGGPLLGPVVLLEARGKTRGYREMLGGFFEELSPDLQSRILEVGCGSGAVMRWLAERTGGSVAIDGVDINAYLLAESRSLTERAGQSGVMSTREGSALAIPFPDNHFDIVTSNLLIHEVPGEKIKEISAEAYRTLRPGGIYYPLDSYTGGQMRGTALSHYNAWRNYRWNHEVWWMEYYHYDLAEAMREVGFKVDENGPKARSDTTHNVIGYKV